MENGPQSITRVVARTNAAYGENCSARINTAKSASGAGSKALFRLTGLDLLSTAAFPVLPDATRYAMGALKHSVHSCCFCYHQRTTSLDDEVAFFRVCLGRDRTLQDLLNQRKEHHRSFAFVLRCVLTLFRLHLRTMRDNRFPRAVARVEGNPQDSRRCRRTPLSLAVLSKKGNGAFRFANYLGLGIQKKGRASPGFIDRFILSP